MSRDCLTDLILAAVVAPLVLAAAVGEVAALVLVCVTASTVLGPSLGLQLAFVGIVTTYLLALTLHETGHALGGWLVGWRPVFVHVGPFTFTWAGGRMRLGWS